MPARPLESALEAGVAGGGEPSPTCSQATGLLSPCPPRRRPRGSGAWSPPPPAGAHGQPRPRPSPPRPGAGRARTHRCPEGPPGRPGWPGLVGSRGPGGLQPACWPWVGRNTGAAEPRFLLHPLAPHPRAAAVALPGVSPCHLSAAPELGPGAEGGRGEAETRGCGAGGSPGPQP